MLDLKKIVNNKIQVEEALSKRMGNSANLTAIKVKAGQYAAKFIAKEGIMLLLKR